jgi:hypothetical protein
VPADTGDPGYAAWRRATLGRIWMAVVLIVADVGLAAIASVAWQAVARGSVPAAGVAAMTILGVAAVVGIPLLVVVALANARAARARSAGRPLSAARRLGVVGQWLAVARLVGLLVAAVAVTVAVGLTALTGLADSCAVGIAVLDASFAVLLAGWTGRALRRG